MRRKLGHIERPLPGYVGEVEFLLETAQQELLIDAPISTEHPGAYVPVPTLSKVGSGCELFISASELAAKAKQFDDGLYAAIELLAQRGGQKLTGKAELLERIARLVLAKDPLESGDALLQLIAAHKVGTAAFAVPTQLQAACDCILDKFMANEQESQPLGFYTWSQELERIFRQDRLLQHPVPADSYAPITYALTGDRQLGDAYLQLLKLCSRLTNPLLSTGLSIYVSSPEATTGNEEVSFLPPSTSFESFVWKTYFAEKSLPANFSLMDELIKLIQSRRLSLAPGECSGWYDHQLWALEPLVIPELMPEHTRVKFTPRYRERLNELFKGLYALTRETHVKQLEGMYGAGIPSFRVQPDFSIEPLPSHYLRRANSYGYIKAALTEVFGDWELARISRLRQDSSSSMPLIDELEGMEGLFYGAYLLSCRELGLEPVEYGAVTDTAAEDAIARLLHWKEKISEDPDIGSDVRMMVPAFYDEHRKALKAWLFLGWTSQNLVATYEKEPEIIVEVPASSNDQMGIFLQMIKNRLHVYVRFYETYRQAAYPVFAEVYVRNLMSRDEFRAHCDKHRTVDRIIANLPGAAVAPTSD